VFGRQTIIDRYDNTLSAVTETAADHVLTIEIAHDPAAAMVVDQDGSRVGSHWLIDSDRIDSDRNFARRTGDSPVRYIAQRHRKASASPRQSPLPPPATDRPARTEPVPR